MKKIATILAAALGKKAEAYVTDPKPLIGQAEVPAELKK
jgi:hypothetical protein